MKTTITVKYKIIWINILSPYNPNNHSFLRVPIYSAIVIGQCTYYTGFHCTRMMELLLLYTYPHVCVMCAKSISYTREFRFTNCTSLACVCMSCVRFFYSCSCRMHRFKVERRKRHARSSMKRMMCFTANSKK